MSGLFLDLSDLEHKCARLRLHRYHRRQIYRNEDDPGVARPSTKSPTTDAAGRRPRISQRRTLLASSGRTADADCAVGWLHRFAAIIAMANAPGDVSCAGRYSVVPAGCRGNVEVEPATSL